MATEPLRVGLIGVGVGARQLLPAFSTTPTIKFQAAADVRQNVLDQLAQDYGVATYTSVEALCEDPDVEAVWVATPNQFHAEHVIAAAERGKHVIVSKPMCITLEQAEQMNDAAERYGVHLLAGHTQSMAPTIRKMAEMAQNGELGKLGMVHTWHYTDWMYRPRMPEELDAATGGGPVFRQASHQVDIVRLIAGGVVRSVRAQTLNLDPGRGTEGAYTAFLEFENGVPATVIYSGYGHLDMGAWLKGREKDADGSGAAAPVKRSAAEEAQAKEAQRFGGSGGLDLMQAANTLGLFGLTLVTCEQGDLRESMEGLYVYQNNARRAIQVPDELRGAAELEEMYRAVRFGEPLSHSGRWGEATLEVCLAIHESSRTQREIKLTRQTPAPSAVHA